MTEIQIVQGDITEQSVDAIVNAANQALAGGGGVDGAIHRAAGPELMIACRQLGGCPTGEVRLTPGFNLPAKWVIHAVGPVWYGGGRGEAELLASCYRNALSLADKKGLESIAFAAISCGVYGYPLPEAAAIAIDAALDFVGSENSLQLIRFVLFSDELKSIFDSRFMEVATG